MRRLPSRGLLLVILLAASLGLIVLGQAGYAAPARQALLAPLVTLQRGVARAWSSLAGLFQRDPEAGALRLRNAELEAEVAALRQRVVALEESQTQLQILSNLLDYARSQTENRYLAANVIGLDASPFLSYLILDRGSDDGVARDMPVVTEAGLVGRITEVTSAASKVQLVSDTGSAVNALLQTSRERGVVVGRVGGGLQLQFITQQVEVRPGERVLTSGLGGLFPAGILIGTVSAVQRLDYEVLQQAEVVPGVNFNQLEIVLIVTNFTPIDLGPLQPESTGP